MRTRKCRVCKVEKAASQLDGTGRCHGCARVKAATDAGMTYGKYTAMMRSMNQDKQAKLENRIHSQRFSTAYCKNCGGVIPNQGKYEGFCCRECQITWEKRELEKQERGAVKEKNPKKHPAATHRCLQCGAEITARRKYCNDTCKYLYNQERMKKKKEEREAAKVKEHSFVFCRNCGKEIHSSYRKVFCGPECARAGHILQKRQRRAMEKKEREDNE